MSDDSFDILKEIERLCQAFPALPFLARDLNDTTVVLLATSFVDKFLRLVLLAGFRKDVVSKRRIADVFEGHGPLATFSAKISVSSMLGLVPVKVRHDLSILRKI